MTKRIIVYLFFTTLFIACNSTQHGFVKKNGDYILPPGNIQVEANLFIDQYEVTNFNWQEYLYYQCCLYGKTSEIYKACLPDTTVWSRLDSNLSNYSKYYFKHPSYRSYPVIGISYQQAKDFAKWRSDRVMQFILIKNDVIPLVTPESLDSNFTIEKYYAGEYLNYEPDSNYYIYPKFELIDSLSYVTFSTFSDSVNLSNFKPCKKDSLAATKLFDNYYSAVYLTNPDYIDNHPILSVDCNCNKKRAIPNLYSNVSELTDQEGIIFGSGYGDSTVIKNTRPFSKAQLQNSLIGVRFKCTYQTWQK